MLPLARYLVRRTGAAALGLALVGLPCAAQAQEAAPPPAAAPDPDLPIDFEADGASYDSEADRVSVFGNVVLRRGDQSVRADKLTWDRKTGQIVGEGNIRFVDQDGNQLFTDRIELTEELKAGAMENMLLALREGGRLAANRTERGEDESIVLHQAVYSACAVEDDKGCPRDPSWRIVARRVIYDPKAKKVRFNGARLELFGAPLIPIWC
jgi:LPS-assembly protein